MAWPIILLLVSVFALAAVAVMAFVSRQQEQRQRYLSVIARSRGTVFSAADAEKTLAKHRAELARKLKETGAEQQRKKKDKASIREMLNMIGSDAPVSRYWIGAGIFAAFVALIVGLLTSWPVIAKIFVVFAAFAGVPKLFLKWKAARRQNKFLIDFPDALDAMVRLLQAGMPITEAIAMCAREFSGPLREEMLRVHDNQKVGVSLGEATHITAQRIPLTEVHMFATALQIQSETGSSLSEVLSNLSHVIRARFRLKRKIKALSSEAKASAAIIGCLPLLVTFGLYMARPEYIGILFATAKGKMLVAGAAFWMAMGMLVMRQMINFRI